MTRPPDWDFSKVSGDGKVPAGSELPHGKLAAFAIDVQLLRRLRDTEGRNTRFAGR